MLPEICELDPKSKKPGKKMRIINLNDNWVGKRYT